uniref:Uncharacterized protein n=1 Tax=Palpitomonas bilix TaxID=652834 RepID=A0A7S3DG87_9EUKA|mmetsp:Transcript_36258/g.94304  ORF Transcript_36258/g.94304 Transcript_36258/m.94304 type:complete len:104 (+) Transcript_36258:188-499(+)
MLISIYLSPFALFAKSTDNPLQHHTWPACTSFRATHEHVANHAHIYLFSSLYSYHVHVDLLLSLSSTSHLLNLGLSRLEEGEYAGETLVVDVNAEEESNDALQ